MWVSEGARGLDEHGLVVEDDRGSSERRWPKRRGSSSAGRSRNGEFKYVRVKAER